MTTTVAGALQGVIPANLIYSSKEEIEKHSFDLWPVAVKWKQQNRFPHSPDVVVKIESTEQVSHLLKWATENQVPVTPWGNGSAVTGAPIPLKNGIVLNMTSMNKVLDLNKENLSLTVQAGKIGGELETELNKQGYTLNHSPQSLHISTVGGWVSTFATGQYSSRYGGIEELLVGIKVVLPNGDIVSTPYTPRAAIGPDLKRLFIGAEGTLGVVTEVTLRIFPLPEERIFETIAFDTVEQGLKVMQTIMHKGLNPFLVRFYDVEEARHAMRDSSYSKCVMFLGFEGIKIVARAEYASALKICHDFRGNEVGPKAALSWMDRRFDFSTVKNILEKPEGVAETIEVSHMWDGILETYKQLKVTLAPHAAEVLGHFSHTYAQGTSLYIILLGAPDQAKDSVDAEQKILEIWDVSMKVCLKTGASISHHHGVGIARQHVIRENLGSNMGLLESVKTILDPTNIMNPNKLGLINQKGN